jgi:RNA polymerase sigma-70 factor (ECF subfamily)
MALPGAHTPKQHAGTRAPAPPRVDARQLADDLRWLGQRARAIVRSEDLARDLVQDTFLAWFERPPELRGGLRPWLEGVLRNQLRMRTRGAVRRERRETDTHDRDRATAAPTPEGLLDRAQIAALIEREVDAVAEPYRGTLRLRYWEGLRPVEIAQRLGLPQSTVRRRNLVGLELLRERLERRFDDRDELDATLVRAFALPLPLLSRLRRAGSAVARPAFVPVAAAAALAVVFGGAQLAQRARGGHERGASRPGHGQARPHAAVAAHTASDAVERLGPEADPEARNADASDTLASADDRCGTSLQARVDAARPWSTVRLPAGCVFREAVRVDKPLVLEAAATAELRGSDVLAGWRRVGDVWVSEVAVPAFPEQACTPTPPGGNADDAVCAAFELVFVDGVRLPRVEQGAPRPGEWALDEHRHVVLGAAPAGALVEVTTRPTILTIAASDVVVRGLTLRHAMGGPRTGAIEVEPRLHDVRFERVRASDAGGPMLVWHDGHDHAFVDGDVAGAGGPALLALGSMRLTIARNHLHGNGWAHRLDNGWITAGVKIEHGSVDVDGNLVDGNRGEGVVCAGCFDSHVHGNTMRDNLGAGVIMLLSHRSVVDRNRLWNNGFGFAPARPAMFVVQSSGVRVAENVLAFHRAGVAVLPLDRDELPDDWDACAASRDNAVDGNVIVSVQDPLDVSGDPRPARSLPPCRSNRASANGVWSRSDSAVPDALRDGVRTLSDGERDELLARYGIPSGATL